MIVQRRIREISFKIIGGEHCHRRHFAQSLSSAFGRCISTTVAGNVSSSSQQRITNNDYNTIHYNHNTSHPYRCKDYNITKRWISSSKLEIEHIQEDESKFEQRPPNDKLVFGTTPTDHMLCIEWDKVNLWHSPKIVPYQDLRISPAASCLHYGTSNYICFYMNVYVSGFSISGFDPEHSQFKISRKLSLDNLVVSIF